MKVLGDSSSPMGLAMQTDYLYKRQNMTDYLLTVIFSKSHPLIGIQLSEGNVKFRTTNKALFICFELKICFV